MKHTVRPRTSISFSPELYMTLEQIYNFNKVSLACGGVRDANARSGAHFDPTEK